MPAATTLNEELKGLPRLKEVTIKVQYEGMEPLKPDPKVTCCKGGNVLLRTTLIDSREPIIELQLHHKLQLEAGDSIEIIPPQNPAKVSQLMELMGFKDQYISHGSGQTELISRALSKLDFVPKKVFLRYLAEFSKRKGELLVLLSAQGRLEYQQKYADFDCLNFCREFEVENVPLESFLEFLVPIKSRYYSVSRIIDQETIAICFKVVKGGLCTSWLAMDNVSNVVFSKHARKFEFKPNKGVNTLMVANGTGVAPFIGIMEEMDRNDECILLYGHRTESDTLYPEILSDLASTKSFTVKHAYSQLDSKPKDYCQDLLFSLELEVLCEWNIMVCGSGMMGKQVEDYLITIYSEKMELDRVDAIEFWKARKSERKLLFDLW